MTPTQLAILTGPMAGQRAATETRASQPITELNVLLIDDSPADSALVRRMIARSSQVGIELDVRLTLKDGLARLAEGGVDLIVLDLSLPDSTGLATVSRVSAAAPGVPIVVLSGHNDDALALEAVRYAVERNRLLASLRGLSLVDELTGLYNRRGFMTLAQAHLRAAQRAGRRVMLVFADLDGLKQITIGTGIAKATWPSPRLRRCCARPSASPTWSPDSWRRVRRPRGRGGR
jgi:PleD family two-component response regulator